MRDRIQFANCLEDSNKVFQVSVRDEGRGGVMRVLGAVLYLDPITITVLLVGRGKVLSFRFMEARQGKLSLRDEIVVNSTMHLWPVVAETHREEVWLIEKLRMRYNPDLAEQLRLAGFGHHATGMTMTQH